MKTTTAQNRRYYLHQKIKQFFKYSSKKKTVFVPWNELPENEYLDELKEKYGYSVQLEIN